VENGNDRAGFMLAGVYANGLFGETQDIRKANELYLIAGELGCAEAYHNLGNAYSNGRTVEVDEEKAKHYWELAAMGGDVMARCNLGFNEVKSGNFQRAKKHFLISARAGDKNSLDRVQAGFRNGIVTKHEYEEALRAYHNRQLEMKSDVRDVSATFSVYRE